LEAQLGTVPQLVHIRFPTQSLVSGRGETIVYVIPSSTIVPGYLVPLTILREGPYGFGMVQEWIDIDHAIDLTEFFSSDHPRLRSMAIFDAIINNTDRKIGHLLPIDQTQVFGCDHGVTFHVEDKLRTVLWQWAEEPFTEVELAQLRDAREALLGSLGQGLEPFLTAEEISATATRVDQLLETGSFPLPNPNWPAVPWPAY
jgi:uncharacterized repeat protein (TIGR03843 family)